MHLCPKNGSNACVRACVCVCLWVCVCVCVCVCARDALYQVMEPVLTAGTFLSQPDLVYPKVPRLTHRHTHMHAHRHTHTHTLGHLQSFLRSSDLGVFGFWIEWVQLLSLVFVFWKLYCTACIACKVFIYISSECMRRKLLNRQWDNAMTLRHFATIALVIWVCSHFMHYIRALCN